MEEPLDPLEAAWTALREHWDEDARHDAFVSLAAQLGRLPEAASKYNGAESDPDLVERAAVAKKRIVARAMAQLDALPRSSMEAAKRRGRAVLPVALFAFMFAMSWLMRTVTHNRAFVSWPALALEIVIVALLPWKRILR